MAIAKIALESIFDKNLIMKSLKNTLNLSIGFIALIAIALGACNQSQKKTQDDLQQSVIASHDSLMNQMSTLMEKKMQLNYLVAHLDSLKAKNPSLDTADLRVQLNDAANHLAKADEDMMAWMHEFSPEYDGKSEDEVITYLKGEQEKLNNLENAFKQAIVHSDSLVRSLNK
ncbi:hypothetical protein BCY91_09670 [Pelobium manganitolerans]|uniref:Viral A-type inclusion protein n=2 Tax=Pelobium manganitolerans TaxID=1842495 RepID=A0A419S3E8_9SPHI|nr:hypothetical protein BCY91_09670 [Pelobium manganitolerans]